MPLSFILPDESPIVDLEYGFIVNVSDEEILADIAAWERDVDELCHEALLEDLVNAYRGVEVDDEEPDPDVLAAAEDDDEEWVH